MQELPAEALTSLSASLTHITISNCPALSSLADELCHLPHLCSLTLSFLPLLTSLPASLHLLSHSLHHLDISSCDSLQSLPASLTALSALRSLNVSACGALACLPSAPAALPSVHAARGGSSLRVALYARLTALPRTWMHLPSLQELIVDGNGQMESLFDGDDTVHNDTVYYDTVQSDTVPPFPSPLPSLHSLTVSNCPHVSRLHAFLSCSPTLLHLKLHGLSTLALLPFHTAPNADVTGVALTGTDVVAGAGAAAAVGSDTLEGSGGMIGLVTLQIDSKDNTHITHLPHSLFSLPSLATLTLSHLSHIASIPHSLSFLAPTLTHLHISHCPLLTALSSSLCRLSFLRSLVIQSCASLTFVLGDGPGEAGEVGEGEGGGEGEREREWEGKDGKREEEGEGKGEVGEGEVGKGEVGEVGNVEDMKRHHEMDATKEVPIVGNEGDNVAAAIDIDLNLEDFVLKKQEKHISVLQTQYREIRRGNLYQPAPAAERVANAANSRAAPADAPPAVPPPTGARAEPPTAAATAFGSCPSALPRFVHGKTDVETWLSIAEDFMSIHNVRSEARVVAATLALDDTASKLVYANKHHAEANGHPFGWEEFKAAMLAAFLSQPPALEVRSCLENIQCGDQPVREYAKEFEKTLSLLKTALPESKVIHQFFKGLPEHIKRVHVVRGEHQWRTYKECKEQVIDADVNFRAYMTHVRAQQQPSAEGPRGGGSRTQAHRGGGSWKRPYQQKGESSGTQSKRAHAGLAKDPQDEDKPSAGCRICGKLGHKSYHCGWRKSVKNSGKPNQGKKPDGSGPSGSKDFPKSN
ncbi:unnamed protein product [Closterium sp. NIES-65]|nr:unnamed protein product [Closterium sp. NIES-65]